MLKFANESMNELAKKKKAGTVTVTSLPNMQKRTNERRNERLHGQTAVQAKRANAHMHTLLTLPFLRACVCGRVKVKFTATTTTPAPRVRVRVRVLPTRCVRDERWKSTEFAGKQRGSDVCAGDFGSTCLTSSWAQSSAAAALLAILWLLIVLASRRMIIISQLLNFIMSNVCVCEWERERVRSHYNELMTNLW